MHLLTGSICATVIWTGFSRPIKAGGTRRGNDAVCTSCRGKLKFKLIAAHQPTRRMDDHVVTNARAFGIQTLQNTKRAAVAKMRNRLRSTQAVIHRKRRMPGH